MRVYGVLGEQCDGLRSPFLLMYVPEHPSCVCLMAVAAKEGMARERKESEERVESSVRSDFLVQAFLERGLLACNPPAQLS